MALGPFARQLRNVLYITDLAQLDPYGNDWDRLADCQLSYFPRFEDARRQLEVRPFLAAIDESQGDTRGIAVFVNQASVDQFAIGERHLFSVPACETRLYGGNILGSFGGSGLDHALRRALDRWRCDLFTIGEVDRQSPLISASADLSGLARIQRTRSEPIRWQIALPTTFEDYLKSLRQSTRKAIGYAIRHFERDCEFTHEIVARPAQVEGFLRAAEHVSRRTYQWDVGDRLINDDATRAHLCRLAKQGRFRGHLIMVGHRPCAFTFGEVSGQVFNYKTPGYDPRWRRYSPGLVLLALTIRDVIEQTGCDRFDFGPGGDVDGYKARFGNFAIPSYSLQFARVTQPRGVALFAGHAGLSLAKQIVGAFLRNERLRQRMRRMLRRNVVRG